MKKTKTKNQVAQPMSYFQISVYGRKYGHCCEVYEHMCTSAQICTCVEFIGHVSLISSPPFVFFKMDTEPLLIWLGSFKALPCLPHNPALSPSITDEDHHAQSFYEGAGKQNSGPHVYMAEMILAEPSLQSLNSLFRLISQYDKSLLSFLVVLLFTPIVFSISFNFFKYYRKQWFSLQHFRAYILELINLFSHTFRIVNKFCFLHNYGTLSFMHYTTCSTSSLFLFSFQEHVLTSF